MADLVVRRAAATGDLARHRRSGGHHQGRARSGGGDQNCADTHGNSFPVGREGATLGSEEAGRGDSEAPPRGAAQDPKTQAPGLSDCPLSDCVIARNLRVHAHGMTSPRVSSPSLRAHHGRDPTPRERIVSTPRQQRGGEFTPPLVSRTAPTGLKVAPRVGVEPTSLVLIQSTRAPGRSGDLKRLSPVATWVRGWFGPAPCVSWLALGVSRQKSATDPIASQDARRGSVSGVAGGHRVATLCALDTDRRRADRSGSGRPRGGEWRCPP